MERRAPEQLLKSIFTGLLHLAHPSLGDEDACVRFCGLLKEVSTTSPNTVRFAHHRAFTSQSMALSIALRMSSLTTAGVKVRAESPPFYRG